MCKVLKTFCGKIELSTFNRFLTALSFPSFPFWFLDKFRLLFSIYCGFFFCIESSGFGGRADLKCCTVAERTQGGKSKLKQ